MTGNKKLDTLITAIMFLTTTAVVGIFYYTEVVYKKPLVNESKEKESLLKESADKSIPQFYKIDKMVISLTPTNGPLNSRMRWLEIAMQMVLFESADEIYVSDNIAIVKDEIIGITSKMGPDELNSISGKILLEDRLKKAINKSLQKPVIKNIFFTNFIVQ